MINVGRRTICAAVLAVVACGCSDSSAKDEGDGVQASKMCAGALDAPAATALERISGTDRFEELTGTNDSGEPNRFSVSRTVKHLHDELTSRSSCSVYKAGDNSGKPVLDIDFSASQSHPEGTESPKSVKATVTYPLGVYAVTTANGAQLFFRCTTKASSADAYVGDAKYVMAEMYSMTGDVRGGDESKDRMTVLNSVARAVAKEAGCTREAALPNTVPAPAR
ncbi:hypothetical protein ACIREE_36295 [Streptomyces sp. NPDC102467]|uniref:hypothetical protein n=1 Tax=Streptomyces sp. NPDC102467 TaxID=3366179 RepID=UPI00382D678E